MTIGRGQGARPRRRDLRRELARQPQVVVVEERDPGAAGGADADVARLGVADAGARQREPQARVADLPQRRHRRRVVAVGHHHHLERRPLLRQRRAHRLDHHLRPPPGGDHHRDLGPGRRRQASPQPPDAVGVEPRLDRDQREIARHRLRDQHPVERIAVRPRQQPRLPPVLDRDGKFG